ncbi:hypothetical protein ACGH2B_12310 [Streptomyces sp. BBFR2]|uniref:hypothetical protein n=1 Tax=Streptomyces sp. BBFR2 TaxID=3372854 RepID=UPI0037DA7927
MTTPATRSTAPTPPAAPDPFAPSTRALRVFAGLGFPLLAVAYGAFVIVVLQQAYSGDGASGPFLGASQLSMGLSAVTGLAALCLPTDAITHTTRRRTVTLQYVLALTGPALAAIDFA